ncbi:hypothetical protein Gogos_010326 [Gossypium gossypioides]|uniref:Uncharacterized protein n=1 Tax=Gossypium gossypioides TaxID=34282 RepID=A0A7J9BKW0_GOSGO|nr:hypothetical protein [Gossypium gossypioides]
MVVDLDAVPTLSLRDKLLGKRVVDIEETNVVFGIGVNEDFDFLEGDVTRSIVNGIPVLVNGAIQQVEFKSLMTIYFSSGRYGHAKKMCPKPVVDLN